eukprot:scaffold103913_cov18-Prasinocladus_malaysianus.AAC.1
MAPTGGDRVFSLLVYQRKPPSSTPAACVMPGMGACVFCCGYNLGSCAVRGTDRLENTEQVGNHGAWT